MLRPATVTLYDGTTIPAIAYGSGTAWYKSSKDAPLNRELIDSVKLAISVGYRHIDTAEIYGTEPEIGQAIKEAVDEGLVKREDLVIATKLLPNAKNPEAALKASLEKLQLPNVDIYYLHAPFLDNFGTDVRTVWTAMESLQKQGLAKHIAVSNFNVDQLKDLLSYATVKPVLNQVEFNPYCNDRELLQFVRDNKIVLAAYSPLASVTKFSGGSVDGAVKEVAQKKGLQDTQVLLRWVVEQGVVAVTTTGKKERMEKFLEASGVQLENDEVERITKDGGKEKHRIYWTDKYKD